MGAEPYGESEREPDVQCSDLAQQQLRTEAMLEQQAIGAVAAEFAAAVISTVVELQAAAGRAAVLEEALRQQAEGDVIQRAREAQATQAVLQQARRQVAVMRIARHWKAWRCSGSWKHRCRAAAVIQGAARGMLLRRRLGPIQLRAAAMHKVRARARSSGCLDCAAAAGLASARQSHELRRAPIRTMQLCR